MAAETIVNVSIVLENNSEAIGAKYLNSYSNKRNGMIKLANLITAVASGIETGMVIVSMDKANGAAAAITCAITYANVDDGDYLLLFGVVFTAKTGTPSTDPYAGEFKKETDETVTGDNLAAAINAHPALKGLCTAANVTGTVTITMSNGGIAGNAGKMTPSDATAFTIGGSGVFSGGAIGTVGNYPIRAFNGGL